MEKRADIRLILYAPKTQSGKQELARRVADVHAAAVHRQLTSLRCPARQKQELLDALIRNNKKDCLP